ncbi:MAG: alpha-galactosidase [Ruminococcus sp.]|nr:alpha-galactosidase [Ruminococcus sp.]
MSIRFDETTKIFTLETKNSTYQMQVADYNVLLHLYYGRKIYGGDTRYLVQLYDRGFSGQIPEAGNKRDFSLDALWQEYPGFGVGDYRTEAIRVVDANGGYGINLMYESHKIYKGKYSLKGLPAVYASEDEAETLEITMRDRVTDTVVILYYAVLPEYDIITRAAKVINGGKGEIILEKAASACLEFQNHDFDMIHFHGRYAMEREYERTPIHYGVQAFGSVRGQSSHHNNPCVILCEKNATETMGDCYGMTFVYSGNFNVEVEVDHIGQTRLLMGIHSTQFAFHLGEGEEFVVPEAIMSYCSNGISGLSYNFHRTLRNNVCRGKYKYAERPILINNWEATYFTFDEEKLFGIASKAKELGVEMFVMDDGWFGKRDNDQSGLGDWFVNENKIKGGLGKLVERVNDIGMKFGIWFEPESVSEDSDLYREHPDWCLTIPGREPGRSRFQLTLDMSREDVREYLYERMCSIFDSANIEYVKWDVNRSLSDVWSAMMTKERQGEVYHRYILGLYDLLEKLVTRYPDILFEGCAGGGGRFDAGMLYYTPQIWASDNTDAIERISIQYGTSFCYPISTVGTHVSVCPNHYTHRSVPLNTRVVVAMGGSFGYELDINVLDDNNKKSVTRDIQEYKKYRKLIHNGRYERLSNPYEEKDYAAWEFVSEDGSEALLNYVLTKKHSYEEIHYLKLRGLDENALYACEEDGMVYSGAALMYAGIPITRELHEYDAVQKHFVRC